MEIINSLEPTGREVYTGAIGYAGPLAGLALNVAIRTFEFSGGRVRLGVGGGIVADSDPHEEAHETLVKAVPLLAAVGARLDEDLRGDWARHAPAPHETRERTPCRAPARPDPARGLFTTLLVRRGAPVDLDAHLARLGASVGACYGVVLPAALREDVLRAAAALAGPHRLRVTAVPAPGGAVATATAATALTPGPALPWRLVPVVLPGGLGAHKWADRRLLEREPEPGLWSPACDPLLVEPDGTVLEAGRANVFVVRGEEVLTPPADGRILPGVVRARVVEALRGAGRPVRERPVGLAELAGATEVFVTNSVRGVCPVTSVDGAGRWGAGPLARRLQEALGHPQEHATAPA
jgi:para-aminobenzoate synthetase/4-amino-4-deoxychorismate lyase